MTIKQLEYFMEVARTLNFSEAAQKLYISQPALSRSINALEQEIGVTLFFRNRHTVLLTPAGAVLAGSIPRLGTDLSRLVAEVQQTEVGQRGRLRLALCDGLPFTPELSRTHNRFRDELPLTDLFPVCLTREEIVVSLKEQTTDISFSFDYRTDNDPATKSITVGTENYCIAISRNSPFASKKKCSLHDLRSEKFFLACTESSFEVNQWRDYCSARGYMPQLTTVLNQPTLSFCVEHGYGFAVLPESHMLFQNPGVCCLRMEDSPLVWLQVKWDPLNRNPLILTFLQFLNQELSKESN